MSSLSENGAKWWFQSSHRTVWLVIILRQMLEPITRGLRRGTHHNDNTEQELHGGLEAQTVDNGTSIVRAQFEENDNVVEFEVERHMEDEFPSEGELSETDQDSDEGTSVRGRYLDLLMDRFGYIDISRCMTSDNLAIKTVICMNNNASNYGKLG